MEKDDFDAAFLSAVMNRCQIVNDRFIIVVTIHKHDGALIVTQQVIPRCSPEEGKKRRCITIEGERDINRVDSRELQIPCPGVFQKCRGVFSCFTADFCNG